MGDGQPRSSTAGLWAVSHAQPWQPCSLLMVPHGPQPLSVETPWSLIPQHPTLKSAPSTSSMPSWGHVVGRKPILDLFNVFMCGRWLKCRLIVQFFQYFHQTYFKNIGPEAPTVCRGKFTALLLRAKLPQAPASKGKTRKEMNSCLKTAHLILWVINFLAGTQSTHYWEIFTPISSKHWTAKNVQSAF